MFRRGHLPRFLLAAAVLVLDGAAIVYLLERHAPGSNIRTLGESVWFSLVTVTTVGYGDYTPVTPAGRVTACCIMAIGLLTLAVFGLAVAVVCASACFVGIMMLIATLGKTEQSVAGTGWGILMPLAMLGAYIATFIVFWIALAKGFSGAGVAPPSAPAPRANDERPQV